VTGPAALIGELRLGADIRPVTIYALAGAGREGLEAIASALGLEDQRCEARAEENGWPYLELTGHADGLNFRIAAGDGPVLLDPLTDEGAIRREYAPAVTQ
jgi:hypothetical protein